ncbi:uncharacterized protein LOC142334036 [Lycorma delicatula]|uniref:uncharacterized protein LOC142334036 n=1 Tax=Lycorma delicatula TaxID=130591 RepID=UPI003F50E2EC
MTIKEESEPLLVQTKNTNGTLTNPTYKSIGYANSEDEQDESSGLYMDTITGNKSNNLRKKSFVNNKNGSGGSSPDGYRTWSEFPTENITYTWSNINVFTSCRESRRTRITNSIKSVLGMSSPRTTHRRKHILKNVTGVAYPGELIALMGSSGTGKTTLLNSLTFRNSSNLIVTGHRAINGVPVSSKILASISAYIQQDDLFIGTLTVREHLIFQALVRMDRHIPQSKRMERVDEVISELALTSCKDTIIGVPGKLKGISGGEMKRLSFASEVLTDPPLMFCDEPTSGLDSFMALNVVTVLKSLSNKGKTIICTIHQPSSEVYAMFDKILLMAEGRVAFLGSLQQAVDFFRILGAPCPSHYNPADFFIQLLAVVPNSEESCKSMIELVCDTFASSEIGTKLAIEAEANSCKSDYYGSWSTDGYSYPRALSPYKASWYAQFKAVFWRSWISVWKEPVLIKVRMLQTIMVALMIGVIYFGQEYDQDGVININGALFICISNMTFQNIFSVISVFCSELPIFMREHFNGMYRTDVYFLCKTLAEVPIFLAIPLLFTVVMYYMINLNPDPLKFIQAAIIITLVSTVATSFGYLVSCVSSSVSVALSIGPPVVIPFLLFGGFFLNAGSVPPYFKWLSNLSWFKYGNEALLINQWASVGNITCSRLNSTCPRDGHIILETFNFHESDYINDYVCLILLTIGFRFLAFLALLYRTYRRQTLTARDYGRWAPNDDGITLTWNELSVYVKTPQNKFFGQASPSFKKIISNVTGAIEPGHLVAMMGASGAGKSSLMSCLAHRIPGGMIVDGDIRVNGKTVGSFMQNLSGFMYQEDLFIGTLTVLEHLNLMARLKLDRRVPRSRREEIINDLVNELNLNKCINTRIGGSGVDKSKLLLSGGERKRLAFATECLTNPKLLFCDEPTTGLDSSSAHNLIKMLQKMTVMQGKTVLCTIHQPSSELFELFHQIILVADGRIAFIGPTHTALEFFKSQGYECPVSYNPAEFLISTLAAYPGSENTSKQAVKRICDQFAVSDYAREIEIKVQLELHMATSYDVMRDFKVQAFEPPYWPYTLFWLCYRSFLDIARDPQIQTIRIVHKIGLALMVGLCFMGTLNLDQKGIQSIQGALFILVTENTFSPMYAVLAFFPTQIPLFLREYQNGICSPLQFYLASLISMIPGLIIEPTIFVSIVYWISGLKTTTEAFLFSIFIIFLCINVSTSCGVFFSVAFDSMEMAMAYLVAFDYSLMISSGLFIKLATLPKYISWIQHISWMMYANEALNILQFDSVQNITCEANKVDIPCLDNGLDVLERLSFSPNNFWKDISCMVMLYLIFHALGFIWLCTRTKSRSRF